MEFTVDVHSRNTGYDMFSGLPESMIIIIDEELATKIEELAKEVKRLKVYQIVTFNDCPQWIFKNDEGVDNDIDAVTLHITETEFWWEGYIKFSGIELHGDHIKVSQLG